MFCVLRINNEVYLFINRLYSDFWNPGLAWNLLIWPLPPTIVLSVLKIWIKTFLGNINGLIPLKCYIWYLPQINHESISFQIRNEKHPTLFTLLKWFSFKEDILRRNYWIIRLNWHFQNEIWDENMTHFLYFFLIGLVLLFSSKFVLKYLLFAPIKFFSSFLMFMLMVN